MPLKQCDTGNHYYDHEQYDVCPSCIREGQASPADGTGTKPVDVIDDNNNLYKTREIIRDNKPDVGKIKPQTNDNPKTDSPKTDSPKTQIIYSTPANDSTNTTSNPPVVGWLVIVAGIGKGKDFRLVQGGNKIGRDSTMEICLNFGERSDKSISRHTHATVVYDNNGNEFFIERGDSPNLPTVNGKTVRRDQDLNIYDVIQLGNTKMIFYPLCNDKFNWTNQT